MYDRFRDFFLLSLKEEKQGKSEVLFVIIVSIYFPRILPLLFQTCFSFFFMFAMMMLEILVAARSTTNGWVAMNFSSSVWVVVPLVLVVSLARIAVVIPVYKSIYLSRT